MLLGTGLLVFGVVVLTVLAIRELSQAFARARKERIFLEEYADHLSLSDQERGDLLHLWNLYHPGTDPNVPDEAYDEFLGVVSPKVDAVFQKFLEHEASGLVDKRLVD